jgi:hypothetical protein
MGRICFLNAPHCGLEEKGRMNEMNKKKMYLTKLAEFLVANGMNMSGPELVDHLNRNNFLTALGNPYTEGRGVYKLINETYHWLGELGLDDDAKRFPQCVC